MARETPPKGEAVVDVSCDPLHHLLFENERVRVLRVEIPPGQETTMHRHERDYVMFVLGKAEIREQRQGAELAFRKWEEGQTVFLDGGFVHRVRNLGKEPFRAVLVEVKR